MICPAGVGAKPILVYLLYSFGDNFLIKISFSKHGLHEAEASALRENIQKKGENAYYYAHNRKFEVPPDAKVISGPGLVTGGPPVKLDIEANGSPAEKRVEAIRSFSWTDDGGKVKIYLQLPEGTLQDASQVTCDFQDRSFHLQVACGNAWASEPRKSPPTTRPCCDFWRILRLKTHTHIIYRERYIWLMFFYIFVGPALAMG
ncbi:unnamed protein product [Cladocopium goreaui]|uniref:CS domain-containing protein n=1 Tax=Cladocopium goreaui TaxID=2562237 RepID=A0A9P1FS63_9DINO|nr:unnamed protein product [Cladocopium goreaui]